MGKHCQALDGDKACRHPQLEDAELGDAEVRDAKVEVMKVGVQSLEDTGMRTCDYCYALLAL